MIANATHLNELSNSIDTELEGLADLARARRDAARRLATFFASDHTPDKDEIAMIRVAIQFTARAFRPLDLLCKAMLKQQGEPEDDATSPRPPATRTRNTNSATSKTKRRRPNRDQKSSRSPIEKPNTPITAHIDLTTQSILNSEALLL